MDLQKLSSGPAWPTPCMAHLALGQLHWDNSRLGSELVCLFFTETLAAFLTGIFNRKSSWLKRKPRSVLEEGLGAGLETESGHVSGRGAQGSGAGYLGKKSRRREDRVID